MPERPRYWPAAASDSASWNFRVGIIRFGGECLAGDLDAADPSGLETQCQLGLDPFCLGLEKPAPLQAQDPGLRVLEPPCSARSAQPDLSGGQIAVERQGRAYFSSAA